MSSGPWRNRCSSGQARRRHRQCRLRRQRPFAQLTLADYRRQFETNVFGVLRTIQAGLPELKKTRGHAVIVGSVAGWVAASGISPYSMSKFALRALADAITPNCGRMESPLTLISPGFVVSDIRRIGNDGVLHPEARELQPRATQQRGDSSCRDLGS